ncbi:helix-turn-helix domain-containing protein, partial [Patescibacteria group bacterium]|nr:helix-turn-helix domain-containing protein [Patescibacteria group bacterium]
AEVEQLYGIKQKTLSNWRYLGKGPRWSKPEGSGIYYSVADIEAWFAKGTKGSEGSGRSTG